MINYDNDHFAKKKTCKEDYQTTLSLTDRQDIVDLPLIILFTCNDKII